MCQRPNRQLLDDLVRLKQEQRRNRKAEGLSGYQVDDELELHGLLHREVCRLDVFEDLIDVRGGGATDVPDARRMGKVRLAPPTPSGSAGMAGASQRLNR